MHFLLTNISHKLDNVFCIKCEHYYSSSVLQKHKTKNMIQIGFSIRFEFYELDNLIAIANNGLDLPDNENETQNNSEHLNDVTRHPKEGENEEKVLKMMT